MLGSLDAAIGKLPRVTGTGVQQARLEFPSAFLTWPADSCSAGVIWVRSAAGYSGASFLVIQDSSEEAARPGNQLHHLAIMAG